MSVSSSFHRSLAESTCRSSNPRRGSPSGTRGGGDSGYIHSVSVEDTSSSSVVDPGVGSRIKAGALKGLGTKIPRTDSGKSLPAHTNNFSRTGSRRRTLPSPTYSYRNLMESNGVRSDSDRTFLAEGSARFLVLSDIFPTVFTQITSESIGIHRQTPLDSDG